MTPETVRRLEAAHRRIAEGQPAAMRTAEQDALKALLSAALEIGNELEEIGRRIATAEGVRLSSFEVSDDAT